MEPHAAPQAAARQHVRVVLTPAFCRAECISIYDEPLMYPPPPPHAARWPPCCVRVTLIMRVHHSGPYKYFVFHSLPATAEQRPRLVFSGAHGSTGGGRVFCIPIRLHSSSRVPSSRACISAPRLPLLRSARRPQQRAASAARGAACGGRGAARSTRAGALSDPVGMMDVPPVRRARGPPRRRPPLGRSGARRTRLVHHRGCNGGEVLNEVPGTRRTPPSPG